LSAADARLGGTADMLKFAATYILTLLLMLVIDGTWIALVVALHLIRVFFNLGGSSSISVGGGQAINRPSRRHLC
jgi:hypothetical protein